MRSRSGQAYLSGGTLAHDGYADAATTQSTGAGRSIRLRYEQGRREPQSIHLNILQQCGSTGIGLKHSYTEQSTKRRGIGVAGAKFPAAIAFSR